MANQDDHIKPVVPEINLVPVKINEHKKLRLEFHCLKSISKNMERFAAAFYSSNDPILLRNIEFLRQKFPDMCFNSLLKRRCLDRHYLEFAVTEFLTEINLDCLFKIPKEDIKKIFSCVGHAFTKVLYMLTDDVVRELPPRGVFIIELLPYLPNLKVFRSTFARDDETLKALDSHGVRYEEDREPFDIDKYGAEILDAFPTNRKVKMRLMMFVRGMPKWKAHRYFMAVIQLASDIDSRPAIVDLQKITDAHGREDVLVTIIPEELRYVDHSIGEDD